MKPLQIDRKLVVPIVAVMVTAILWGVHCSSPDVGSSGVAFRGTGSRGAGDEQSSDAGVTDAGPDSGPPVPWVMYGDRDDCQYFTWGNPNDPGYSFSRIISPDPAVLKGPLGVPDPSVLLVGPNATFWSYIASTSDDDLGYGSGNGGTQAYVVSNPSTGDIACVFSLSPICGSDDASPDDAGIEPRTFVLSIDEYPPCIDDASVGAFNSGINQGQPLYDPGSNTSDDNTSYTGDDGLGVGP